MTERTHWRRMKRKNNSVPGLCPHYHDAKACSASMDNAAKVLAELQRFTMDARALFRERNDSAIRALAENIPAGSFGASYQKAFSEMWRSANKQYWLKELEKTFYPFT